MAWFKKDPVTESVKALNDELERLHDLMRSTTSPTNVVEIWGKIKEIQDALIGITKKHNGIGCS